MTNGATPSGWYQDPTGQGDARYWNGTAWTESVNRGGVTVNVAIDPSQAQTPPAPGTQVSPPPPPTAPPPQTVNVTNTSHHSVLGFIFGALIVLFVIVLIYAIVSNNDSGGDTPTPGTNAPAEEQAPADSAPADG